MSRIMLVGKPGSGKTTLIQAIEKEKIKYKKTQSVEYSNLFVDTPGEYLEMKKYITALQISSFDCELVGLIQSCDDDESSYQPGFSDFFTKPVIGIVTKTDLNPNGITRAEMFLKMAGVQDIYAVSSISGSGLDALKEVILGERK